MNESFISKSNLRAKGELRWCQNHPTGFWGKKPDGTWYAKCTRGFKTNTECKVGKNDK